MQSLDASVTQKSTPAQIATSVRYRQKNAERIKARRKEKAYHLTPQARAAAKAYREAHRDENRAYQRKHYELHREKRIQRTRQWVAENPEKVREQRRAYWGYPMTEQEWQTLFRKQGRRCAVCKTKEPGKKGWHTDHNHKTKEIRGILCQRCNLGLGSFEDDPKLLEKALAYLRTSPTR